MPVDLVPQIPVIRRVFEGFRVPVLMEPEMEADDVIATLARRGEERGLDVFIVTADKDARQLIGDHVRILNLRKKKVMDAAALEKDWGIRPDQVVDFLALTGDSVDNVPGVPGIGEGYRLDVPQGVRHARPAPGRMSDRVKGPKKQQSLREHAETARLARRLVTLRDDLPLALDWDASRPSSPDVEALKALCTECGFHRFRDELGAPAEAGTRGSRAGVGGRLSHGRHPRVVRRLPRRAEAAAQVLHRHRDHRARSRSGPSWWACRSAGRPARPITCRCAGRPDRDCSTRRRRSPPSGRSWPTRRREGRPEYQV